MMSNGNPMAIAPGAMLSRSFLARIFRSPQALAAKAWFDFTFRDARHETAASKNSPKLQHSG
jgi:hypothetical protein